MDFVFRTDSAYTYYGFNAWPYFEEAELRNDSIRKTYKSKIEKINEDFIRNQVPGCEIIFEYENKFERYSRAVPYDEFITKNIPQGFYTQLDLSPHPPDTTNSADMLLLMKDLLPETKFRIHLIKDHFSDARPAYFVSDWIDKVK